MDSEVAFKIKARMQDSLLPEQMKKLEIVLTEILEEKRMPDDSTNQNIDIIQKFLQAKKIEGCSKRTEQYYKVRPCVKFARTAAEILDRYLEEIRDEINYGRLCFHLSECCFVLHYNGFRIEFLLFFLREQFTCR